MELIIIQSKLLEKMFLNTIKNKSEYSAFVSSNFQLEL